MFIFSSCTEKIEDDDKTTMNKEEKNIVATWITYQEIKDIVDSSENEYDLNNNINNIVMKLRNFKINVIYLHVRAFDDCFYKSNIYPISLYCTNQNNGKKYDVLQNFIDICKLFDIEVHAWINPYRIRNDDHVNKINKNTLAYEYIENGYNERLIITDNNIYYNPAYIDVQKYILDGIKEILYNYEVDGIHIDDYFYPTRDENIDKEIYKSYIDMSGFLNLSEYRRACINSLISAMYTIVKNYDENICFSISPNGNVEKNYNEYYADVNKWLIEDGYADYIIPQLYFGYEHEVSSFKECLSKWTSINSSKLLIGLGIYKSGNIDIYAKSGEKEWLNNTNIISRQLQDVIANDISGFSLYSSSSLVKDTNNLNLKMERENIIKLMEIYES